MIFRLDLIVLLCLINFTLISSTFQPKIVQLINSDYLLINGDGIFRFKNNNFQQIQKVISTKEEENSLSNIKDNKGIHQFRCFGENICIFVNKYIYVFSSEGNMIKKINISDENQKCKLVLIPFNESINELDAFNYFLFSVDSKGNFVYYFYSFNNNSNKNQLLTKNKISILDDQENVINLIETDFTCHLISNTIICFFSKGINNDIIIKKFSFDVENKIIKLLNLEKSERNFNFNGKIINSFANKEQSKILILYSIKDNKNNKFKNKCAIYDIIFNRLEFPTVINDALDNHGSYSKIIFDTKLNMDYLSSIKKYVLYSLNERNELLIIELDENFKLEKKREYILEKNPFNIINFSLINNNRNYQIVLIFKNNDNINDNEPNIIISNLIKNSRNKFVRNLQQNGGESGNGNGDTPSGGGSGNGDTPSGGDSGNGDTPSGGGSGNDDTPSGGDERNSNTPSGGGDTPIEGGGQGGNKNGGFDKRGERNGQTEGGFFIDFDNKNSTIPRDQIRDNRDSIMEFVEPGASYELKGDDYSIRVAPMGERQEGSTSINFMECEKKLRDYYNISENSTLSVFQTETTSSNNKSLTNKLQYVVYDENNTLLNLSVCENQQIRINYAIKEHSEFNLTRYAHFEEKGIDILNNSDPFFNDICYSYSDGDSDMILSDRISEIFQNYSLCDSGCEYEGLNSSSGTVSCSCPVSSDDDDDEDNESTNLKTIFLSLFSDSTFGVIKCYNLVFSSKSSNIGFWVFLVIIIAHIPLYVWFFLKGNTQIKGYINNEMKKYHYLSSSNENNNEINEDENDDHISNPPKKTKETNEKNRNTESDLIQKSNNINLVKNTAETGGNEDIIENEKDDNNNKIPNGKSKVKLDINQTNTSTSKREVNENIITVYKTEETLGEKDNKLEKKLTEKDSKSAYFLIQIDANNSPDNDKPLESNYILNNYQYETAIKYESRSFWRILYIVMISKDNILNTFILRSPLESKPLRLCLLIFAYTSDLALNTLFYFSDNISDKYHYTGKYLFWYTLFNNILISLISTILSLILGSILNLMADSKDKLEEEFKEEETKLREDSNYKVSEERKAEILTKINKCLKKLKIKMTFFVIIDFIILLFFFYFVTAFCEVYKNTQTSWISDAVMSIIISFPIELAIALAITIVYFLSIKYKWKYVYKLAMFLM